MGKRKTEVGNSKRKFNKKRTNQKHKRQKKGCNKFWIEKCKGNKVPKGKTLVFPVAISRVELFDDHTHRGKSSVIKKDTSDISNVAIACGASFPNPNDLQQTATSEENQDPEETSLKNEKNTSSSEATNEIDASNGSSEDPKSVDNLDNVKDETQATNEPLPFIQISRHQSAKGNLKVRAR